MIKAILFDMDGVLIDAREWHFLALNQALALFGYTISRESHLSTFDGLPTKHKLQILTDSSGLATGLHGIINALKQSYTISISHQLCKPTFNHQFALSRLKADGYKTAVCSNSVRNTVDAMIDLAGLTQYLDVKVSNEDVAKAKPNPEMYQKAMMQLEVEPKECLILEDNENGIKAAMSSGANVMIIDTPDHVTYNSINKKITELNSRI